MLAYMLSAGFAALAGVILAGRLASGSPTLAAEMLLPSIAAVVVGGTAITGGVVSIWRTLVGTLIISVVRIGMTFLDVNIFAQNIVFGVVLIAAVAITINRSKNPDRQVMRSGEIPAAGITRVFSRARAPVWKRSPTRP